MIISGQTINSIVYDSRKADLGSAFVCLAGAKTDGHLYAKNAYDRGCRLFFVERILALPSDADQIVCDNTRIKLALLSDEFFGHPQGKLKIIGVTGTKGKTTVTSLIYDILTASGNKCGLIGTNGTVINGIHRPTANTTPESYELHHAFAEMVACRTDYCIMEVSSQAYLTHRVEGIRFDIGVFTNLSPDHIGEFEHPDFDNYMLCKAALFENSDISVINSDDDHADIMLKHAGEYVTYSIMSDSDYHASDVRRWRSDSAIGVEFCVKHNGQITEIKVPTPGLFSVYNALAAVSVSMLCNIDGDTAIKTLRKSRVRGRFEQIETLPYAAVVIDYAHNELSLRSVLETIAEYEPQRIVCVFGSVGERTKKRRAEMGRVAGEYCGLCILTSDNPGREDPMQIINEINAGIGGRCPSVAIPDRAEAVKYAINEAREGDVILFAGKGHEDYQLIGTQKLPFNERELIEQYSAEVLLRK